jgi:hypothetical protein
MIGQNHERIFNSLLPHLAALWWHFKEADRARMSELSEKASLGTLTAEERTELEGYVLMGHLLAIAHSKARRSLKRHQPAA